MMAFIFKDGESIIMTHCCGKCGGSLLLPWVKDHYEVRCLKDPTHKELTPKAQGARKLYDPARGWVEYNVMTQKEVGTTDLLPKSERNMLVRVNKAANTPHSPPPTVAPCRCVATTAGKGRLPT